MGCTARRIAGRPSNNSPPTQREIHRPILDDSYPFTYAPDPKWCRIIEFYCPSCGTMIENEYLPPGHPLTHDIELDIDSLKARHAGAEGKANAAG